MVEEGRSGILASIEVHRSIEEPTMAQSAAFLDEEVRIRRRFQQSFDDLDPPEPIADLHITLRGAMTRLLTAVEGLAGVAHTVGSLEELEGTPQLREYEAANDDGNIVCLDVQARLDDLATAAPIDNSWIPNLQLTVQAALGCGEIEVG